MKRMENIQSQLSPQVRFEPKPNAWKITFNRPESLNSFTRDMHASLHTIADHSKSHTLPLIFTGEGRAFCAGGDVLYVMDNPHLAAEFFMLEFSLFYKLSLLTQDKVAVQNGIVMGGGVGLTMGCNLRVATPKTLWAMPETHIGYVPDVGASYFLSRLDPPELGLYLSMTGARLKGVDCFTFGLAQYYVEDHEALIRELEQSSDPRPILEAHHKFPDPGESQILPILNEIKQVFKPETSVDFIFEKLGSMRSEWAQKTLKTLHEVCPLSLYLAFESFNRGKHLSYKDCLKQEYDLVIQLTIHRRSTYATGVENKLVKKSKARPNWEPNTVDEINLAYIEPFFLNVEGPKLNLD